MKIGVFGLGFMGSTHLKAWQKLPRAELAAVVSDIPKRLGGDLSDIMGNLGGLGERMDFSGVAKYSDPYQALLDPTIEVVDICLPTNLHAPVAIAALQAGKHVLVEKPMALSGDEADGMIAAAERSGHVLMAAQVVRFMPLYSVTARMIRANDLGPIRAAIFRRRSAAPGWSQWFGDKQTSGGGVFDILIHDIDYCLHVFGKPEAVAAVGHEDMARGIDWMAAELFYPEIGGVVIWGGWHHTGAYPFSMEYTVIGDRGTVEFSAGAPPTLYKPNGEKELLPIPEVDAYLAEIEYFLDCCVQGKKPDFCRPEESAAAVRLARLLQEARERKGEKIPCRL